MTYPRHHPTVLPARSIYSMYDMHNHLSRRAPELLMHAYRVLCVLHMLPRWHRDIHALLEVLASSEKIPRELEALARLFAHKMVAPVHFRTKDSCYLLTSLGEEMRGRLDDPEGILRRGLDLMWGPLSGEEVALILHVYPLPIVTLRLEEAASTEQPLHAPDCSGCEFLGPFTEEDGTRRDLWFCPSCDEGTLILRRGPEGNYSSTPSFLWDRSVAHLPYVGEGIRRLRARGRLPKSYA